MELLPNQFYANDEEREYNVITERRKDGSLVKRLTLPKCLKEAVIEKPTIAQLKQAGRITNDHGKQIAALLCSCLTINGKSMSLDEIENMMMPDYELCAMSLVNIL